MTEDNASSKGQPGIPAAALFGLCPQCGSRTLYDGLTKFSPRCRICGLDYSAFNVGDGAVPFLIMAIGAITTVLALVVEFSFNPPFWVHLLLWVPLVIGLTVLGLRVSKAGLIAAEFRRKAGEGRLKD